MLGRERSRRWRVEQKLVYERIRCMPLKKMGDEENEIWGSVCEAVDGDGVVDEDIADRRASVITYFCRSLNYLRDRVQWSTRNGYPP